MASDSIKRVMARAAAVDERRQVQIERQKAIITRLTAENQLMTECLQYIASNYPDYVVCNQMAEEALENVEKLRKEAREADGRD